MNRLQVVRTHQPDKAMLRKTPPQFHQRLRGKHRAELRLDPAHRDPRMPSHPSCGRHALRQRCHAPARLKRVLRRDEPPDVIEPQPLQGQQADMAVPAMGGVERAAQKADALPTQGKRRLIPAPRLARRVLAEPDAQGRTCPLPRTIYL